MNRILSTSKLELEPDSAGRVRTGRAFVQRSTIVWLSIAIVGAGAIVSVIAGFLVYRFGSLDAGRAWLRGQQMVIVPATLNLGDGDLNERREERLQVVNLSDKTASVLGARASCGCIMVGDQLPFELGPHESRWISITVGFVGSDRDLSNSLTFYSDLPGDSSASATINGRIRTDSAAPPLEQ